MTSNNFNSIDDYIATFPKETQMMLNELRDIIRKSAPNAVEKISYQMPAFALHGILVYFAAYKWHIGFYPTGSAIVAFKQELLDYKTSKGTIQFPIDQALPLDLIGRIVAFRVNENSSKKNRKDSK